MQGILCLSVFVSMSVAAIIIAASSAVFCRCSLMQCWLQCCTVDPRHWHRQTVICWYCSGCCYLCTCLPFPWSSSPRSWLLLLLLLPAKVILLLFSILPAHFCLSWLLHFQCQPPRHRQHRHDHICPKEHYSNKSTALEGSQASQWLVFFVFHFTRLLSFGFHCQILSFSAVNTLAYSIYKIPVNTHQSITWSPLFCFCHHHVHSSKRISQNYLHIVIFYKVLALESSHRFCQAANTIWQDLIAAFLPFANLTCWCSLLNSSVDSERHRSSAVHCKVRGC